MRPPGVLERQGGYDPVHFANLFEIEDRHFWFKARNRVISALVRRVVKGLRPGYRVLEIGCGDGNVLRVLEKTCQHGSVIGMELYKEGLEYARLRTSCPLVIGDINRSPFGKGFHVVGIFDVLEHINYDADVLRDIWNCLEPDGVLLITVPAHDSLWSYFDKVSGHCRRYEVDELRDKLEGSGFQIEHITEYMAALHPLMWLRRKMKSKASATHEELLREEVRIVPVLNAVMSWALSWEAEWLIRKRRLPFGTSLLAVARKVTTSD